MMLLGLLALFALYPAGAGAETLSESVTAAIRGLSLDELERAITPGSWLSEDPAALLQALASGRTILTGSEAFGWLLQQAAGVFQNSLWRMTRLLAPALLVTGVEQLGDGKSTVGKGARCAGLLMIASFLVLDLKEHVAISNQSVMQMSGLMRAVFPLMTAMLAAVGGKASSLFWQPAVMAAAGTVTTLVQRVTMPFAVGVAVLTMVGGLSDRLRVTRLCGFFRQVANWTLGLGFTVFIGIMTVQGLGAAAVDGVSIRTAKYAMDNFVPIVGGMFADTVDTLVGCSLLVYNAVGILGLLLLLGMLLLPMLRTVMTMLLYRAASALLEPLSQSPLNRSIGEYADVFSLLFIIQLSIGAMFLLLTAQLIMVGNLTVTLR